MGPEANPSAQQIPGLALEALPLQDPGLHGRPVAVLLQRLSLPPRARGPRAPRPRRQPAPLPLRGLRPLSPRLRLPAPLEPLRPHAPSPRLHLVGARQLPRSVPNDRGPLVRSIEEEGCRHYRPQEARARLIGPPNHEAHALHTIPNQPSQGCAAGLGTSRPAPPERRAQLLQLPFAAARGAGQNHPAGLVDAREGQCQSAGVDHPGVELSTYRS